MEPKKDEYEFNEEDLEEIEKLAELTEKELNEIDKEVEDKTKREESMFNPFSYKKKFDPIEYKKRLIEERAKEKMARIRKRYWLDNKAPENRDKEGHPKQLDLYDIVVFSKYLDRETLITMLKTNKGVTKVKDKILENKFDFKKMHDFEIFDQVEDYHTQVNEETISLFKEMVEGKDKPKVKRIIIEMKEDGEVTNLLDMTKLINEGMKYESRMKLDNMIDYNKSKLSVTLKELDNMNELGQWCSERAMILVPSIDMAYSNLSTIDLHLCTNLTELKQALMNYENWPQKRGCFEFYSNLTEIVLPSTIEKLGKSTFRDCDHLVSITLPERVNYLGCRCFEDCSSLSSIDLPSNITYIGGSCFSGCRSLRRINIPSQITRLKNFTFSRCTSLSQVILPTEIEILGECCFEDCVMLSDITIPDSITEIKTKCFFNCKSLNNLIILDNVKLGYEAVPNQWEIELQRDGIQSIWNRTYTRNGRNTIDEITAGSPPNENGGFNGFGARRRDNDDN